jgi:UDP-N-acetylglucosamine--N-acetylmuramyl-(pentapeptide) pyrophosphoryl-undecaprenol N-acetylglucosamine transferase
MVQLVNGFRAAKRLLGTYRPAAIFSTGGYVAVPVAVAGRRIPTVLFVPDIEPGLALRSLGRFADGIAVPVDGSHDFQPRGAPVTTTGYPVRADLIRWDQEEARRELGLSDKNPTLLVYGGSKGARSINQALIEVLPALLPEMQVIHISGKLDWPEVEQAAKGLDVQSRERYHPFPYLHDRMGAALAAADLVVARAGASTLGEFPAFGLPAILVPYPHAWRYQRTNAKYLVEQGGARLLLDEELRTKLATTVLDLMRNRDKKEKMRIAMRGLYRPEAANEIGELILAAAASRGAVRKA